MNYANIRALLEPFAGGAVLVGFSGGADSFAALLTVLEFRLELGLELTAIHFEHGLRGEAGRADAEFARSAAQRLGVEFRRIDLKLDPTAPDLENRAREARLAAWQKLGPCVAVLGHHAGDRRENLLLRLFRGGNASSLSSMREISRIGEVTFLRPLLGCEKNELIEFLAGRGVTDFCCDTSNFDPAYRRNFLRLKILPELEQNLPGALHGLDRALEALECDALLLEKLARREAAKFIDRRNFALAEWRELDPALRCRVLRHYLSHRTGRMVIPDHALLARFDAMLRSESPEERKLEAPGGVFSFRGSEISWELPEGPDAPREWRWKLEKHPYFNCEECRRVPESVSLDEIYFDADQLPDVLLIEPPRPGDRMRPFGREGEVKLKKLRTDRKIAAAALPYLLKTPDGVILWAPGVRHGGDYAVTAASSRIVRISLQR
ncbi:MAG: tRNA lysidine(34) synthetase TilS [Victivallaceae bacterium]